MMLICLYYGPEALHCIANKPIVIVKHVKYICIAVANPGFDLNGGRAWTLSTGGGGKVENH